VVLEGEATFTNIGATRLRQLDVHVSPRFDTEWLA
jgi:hypothetical protein